MGNLLTEKFPFNSDDYKLYEEVGEGVSATVYRALCIPLKCIVAIKVLDLEKCNNYLDDVAREVQTMKLIDHPNVLRAHCSFTTGSSLWIVMPYMAGGSCLHIMKSAHSEGFEQLVIVKVLYEVLKALAYLHANGQIHRDVKAGNILVDSKGAVKLADFGVSASMFDTGDRRHSRNTFVGTPCWMAPEVMQQLHGYDSKADIWSFGITALELAHGHAPFSKYPSMKVLLLTLQNVPPGLDYERDKKFSTAFKDMVAACLVKDPKKRPTSKKLLKHSLFKNACSNKLLARTILDGLSPLGDRFRMLKKKEADFLLQNKDLYGGKEQLSQQEYIRGISAWDFDPAELKKQAALIQDCDDISSTENPDLRCKQTCGHDNFGFLAERPSRELLNIEITAESAHFYHGLINHHSVKSSPASSPIHTIQALEYHIDVPVDDVNASSPNRKVTSHLNYEETLSSSSVVANKVSENFEGDYWLQRFSLEQDVISETSVSSSGSVILKNDLSPSSSKASDDHASDQLLHHRITENGRFLCVDEPGFLREGRYTVTRDDSSSEDAPNGFINPLSDQSVDSRAGVLTSKFPLLRGLLQQNTIQREQITRLIRYVNQSPEFVVAGITELQSSLVTARERYLQSQVMHTQRRIGRLVEELQMQKMKNDRLERQLSASINME